MSLEPPRDIPRGPRSVSVQEDQAEIGGGGGPPKPPVRITRPVATRAFELADRTTAGVGRIGIIAEGAGAGATGGRGIGAGITGAGGAGGGTT